MKFHFKIEIKFQKNLIISKNGIMINQTQSRSLFTTIKQIISITVEQEFLEERLHEWDEVSQPLCEFLNISTAEAVIMALYLDAAFRDRGVDTDRLVQHFGKDICSLTLISITLQQLAKKQLLQSKKPDIFQRRRKQDYKKEYQVMPKVMKAVLDGNIDCMQKKSVSTFMDLLDEVADLFNLQEEEELTSEALLDELDPLLKGQQSLPEIQWLLSHKELNIQHIAIILLMLLELLDGEDEVTIDKLIRRVCDDMHDRITLRRVLTDFKSPLINKKIVRFSDDEFLNRNMLRLTETAVEHLMGGQVVGAPPSFRPVLCQLIQPDSLVKETLFYNPPEEKQINLLSEALSEASYQKIRDGLLAQSLKPGFTLLLFGGAGTGKTASVKQIARATGRAILMVDIAKIQSKWVGESEKNLSKVFEEYRNGKKTFANDPILLFNEADAILGKRFSVKSSVDKSYNAMQNILLQELEDFEGIFMATTNLADQLDAAFDRRFVYKISFQAPELEVRKQIMQQAFPQCSPEVLHELVSTYPETGGQIMNVKKKLTIQLLLQPSLQAAELIHQLVKDEMALSAPERKNTIGFMHSHT